MTAPSQELKDRLRDRAYVASLLPEDVQVDAFLAEGGQGIVYRGTVSGKAAAVKVYFPGQLQKRVEREVTLLAALNCPAIVKLLWSGELETDAQTLPAVATSYIPGASLASTIANQPLSHPRIGTLAFDVASAIQAMWQRRVVHRDLKPTNILITPQGRACVIDLGLARHIDQSPLTSIGVTWGTYGYLSPEQCRAVRQLTCKSDVFTLGVILVEASSGAHPANRDQELLLAMGLHEQLPAELASWQHASQVMRMLHPRATMRQSPGELLELFSAYAHDPEGA